MRLGPFLFGLCALAVGLPRDARADVTDALPPIRWSAPATCPSRDDLVDELGHLLRDPGAMRKAIASVEISVTHDAGDRYRLRLTMVGADGVSHGREISGETCSEVVGAAAIALALASDSEGAASAPEHSDPPSSPPAPSVSPIPVAPIPTPEKPPAVRADPPVVDDPGRAPDRGAEKVTPHAAVTWDLEATAGVDFATMPNPSPGFGIGVAAEIAQNRIAIRATGWVPQHAVLPSVSTAGGDVDLVVGSVRYGRSLPSGVVEFLPSAGFEIGAMFAKGVGVNMPRLGAVPWFAPSAALVGVVHPTQGFAVSLELEGLVPVVRPRFDILGGGQVYEPPPVTGRAALGLHGRFP